MYVPYAIHVKTEMGLNSKENVQKIDKFIVYCTASQLLSEKDQDHTIAKRKHNTKISIQKVQHACESFTHILEVSGEQTKGYGVGEEGHPGSTYGQVDAHLNCNCMV